MSTNKTFTKEYSDGANEVEKRDTKEKFVDTRYQVLHPRQQFWLCTTLY